jgi:D-3-phosphoglycerate dehydrogenase
MAEKVALLRQINTAAHPIFEAAGFEVVTFDHTPDPALFTEAIQGARMVGVRSKGLPPGAIELNPQLDVLGCYCVAPKYDKAAADTAAIAVFNSPNGNSASVEQFVMGSIFGLIRGIPEYNRQMHEGNWTKGENDHDDEIDDKVLGIVGMGNIGKKIAKRAHTNGMQVVFTDTDPDAHSEYATRSDSLEDVLKASDFVTLHVPELPSTIDMINDDTLAMMKQGAYLINAARGKVVDPEALKRALEDGHIAAAALDVHYDEPEKNQPFVSVLRGVKNAVLTPHIAGNTRKGQRRVAEEVAEKQARFWLTGTTEGSVNVPEYVLPPPKKGVTRLLYPHTNQHGALAAATKVLDEAGLNVGPQGSNPTVDRHGIPIEDGLAYAYFDITQGEVTKEVMDSLRGLALSRRVRAIPPV